MRHWHSTPFEMCEIKYHIKLPIFIARQWIRHRTANVNEYSARYSIFDKEFYLLTSENLAAQSTAIDRQNLCARGEQAKEVLELLKSDAEEPMQIMKQCLMKNMMVQPLVKTKKGQQENSQEWA